MSSEAISLITLGCVVIAAIVNITSLIGKRETKAAADARLEAKLDIYLQKTEKIEARQGSIESTVHKHGERITAVEQSAKSAHKRLNRIEKIEDMEDE